MSKLTDTQWVELIRIAVDMMHSGLRMGQSYMIALNEIDANLYEQVTATNNDCFYNDNKIINFLTFLEP
jgi:hypothetical protein